MTTSPEIVREAPPSTFFQILRQIGPGLIITASIVGSGELIVTPKLGAKEGFSLLWFIVLGCLIKVFVQIELGRYAITRGQTTLEAMNSIPGPRFIVSWLVWLWLGLFVALLFQLAGIIGGTAEIFPHLNLGGSLRFWAVIVGGSCALLLAWGRYKLVEVASTAMVVVFTFCTIVAVGVLQWTDYRISAAQIASGFRFELPSSFTTAFAAFGIIGVGASELIYYPYWCLEKGYARNIGPNDGSSGWVNRARGWLRVMRADAWVSMVIYTGATVAFYLLGASVLHSKKLEVTNMDLISTLSHMYRETFGQWGWAIFLVGAFNVLYSTVFVSFASNARLLADALSVFRVTQYRTPEDRARFVRAACVALPAFSTTFYLIWKAPVSLVFVGALAQGLMLPFLAGAALYFRFKRTDKALQPGAIWTICLVIAATLMMVVGIYQVVLEIGKKLF